MRGALGADRLGAPRVERPAPGRKVSCPALGPQAGPELAASWRATPEPERAPATSAITWSFIGEPNARSLPRQGEPAPSRGDLT